MARSPKKNDNTPGQDSFLDVIANLVGILIILVMVIGANATQQFREAVENSSEVNEELTIAAKEASAAKQKAVKAISENHDLERRIKEEKISTQLVAAERDAIQQAILFWEKKTAELESAEPASMQKSLAAQNEIAKLKFEYNETLKRIEVAKNETLGTKTENIDHHPTPIAKTVFGDEIHFRMTNDKIAVVPLEELVELVKSNAELQKKELHKSSTTTSTVGPIEGFRLQFELGKRKQTVERDGMVVEHEYAVVNKFTVLPTHRDIGVDASLSVCEKQLESVINGKDPSRTTISIWVYPDAYDQYSKVKNWFAERNFKVAAWPMPHGQPITGSPNGFHSTAQ